MATSISNDSKSQVMKAAWAIAKRTDGKSFSDAMKQAWKAIKLKIAMANDIVTFRFRKSNGEIRTAVGTRQSSIINYENKGTTRKPCYSTVAYWDLDRKAFRSFCITSLI